MSVGKSDIIWSYIAKFLGIASGLLVLPFILNRLTAEEMGLNYLMLTIGSMVSLLDFGFSPQFG
ncbi:polysaccharide biosynthesis protein, partial [Bacteroides thetaiotaomicron]|nr:polysaccharide biosynthesis protein [Bacteroides thetaiotaomicron]